PGRGGGTKNPTRLAADFLQRFRQGATHAEGIGPDDRMLHYFNGTFYGWDRVWRGVGADEIRALVTRDLQDRSGIDAVNVPLVHNVLLNLQGLCLVGQDKEPLPFYIEKYGPPTVIRRRQ